MLFSVRSPIQSVLRPQLGPVLLFGSGVMVEVYNDVALRRTSKMEPQITQNTQMAWRLQRQDDAFNLEARPTEVEKQAEVQAGGFQIIQALRAMNLVDRFHRFQFDDDDARDKQINGIFTDHDPIVPNDHWMLLRDRESRLA
jgi:hypothetical protein